MILGIKPTVDIVFKAIFGTPHATAITLDFVNALLAQAGRPRAQSLEILNPTLPGRFRSEKDIVLDIHARDESDREFQLEIQVRPYAAMPHRMLHNWSRCYLARLGKGQSYQALRPVIAIWILEHEFFGDGSWLHAFSLRDARTGLELSEDEQILVVELPVWERERGLSAGEGIVAPLDRWLYFLSKGEEIDEAAPPGWVRGTPVEEAVGIMATFTKSEAARDAYWRRLEFRMEQATIKAEAESEGRAEGRAEGLVKGRDEGLTEGRSEGLVEGRAEGRTESAREIARRMKERGLEVRQIAELTQLSEEEIAGL